MSIVGYDTEHDRDEPLAGRILRTLCDHYPGHGWFVLIRGGVIQVKDMDIHPNWGMALHYTQVTNDDKAMRQSVVRAAGEFLERAGIKRGEKGEEWGGSVEGVPDRDLIRARLA